MTRTKYPNVKFETVDGETLLNRPYTPPSFVVDTLFGQGLHILAGAPKVGKSWMALWLCLQVSLGEDVWGFTTRQGTALYLCLEDGEARIQSRLLDITDYAPPCLHFAMHSCKIGQGLEAQLQNFINEHPDTVLIVIDTLQLIRGSSQEHPYARDYSDLHTLKKIADESRLAILLIHHTRKKDDDDPFNRISGTTAIQGAVDTSFTLVETKRGSKRAALTGIGRDIEYRKMELQHNRQNIWDLECDSLEAPKVLQDSIVPLVVALMQKSSGIFCGTPGELAGELNALSADRDDKISDRVVYKRLKENELQLSALDIRIENRKSNGKRLINIRQSVDSAVNTSPNPRGAYDDPVVPAALPQDTLTG